MACPTQAIQLTPDFKTSDYQRAELVYDKEDLLIAGEGKHHGYRHWAVTGKAVSGKDKGEAVGEAPPVNLRGLRP